MTNVADMSVEEMLDNLVAYLLSQPAQGRPVIVQDVMHSLKRHNNPITNFVADTLTQKLIDANIIEKMK